MTDPFLTHEERREILREYGRRYGLRVFVETGTANGDTCAALMDDFDHLYTIEIDAGWYAHVQERFAGVHNVTCLLGDSARVVQDVLAVLTKPALFWLDGHRCGGKSGPDDTPILGELDAIFATGIRHVVLIDDARLFGGMPHYGEWDWPHIDEIRSRAEAAGYGFEVADDIVRLTP